MLHTSIHYPKIILNLKRNPISKRQGNSFMKSQFKTKSFIPLNNNSCKKTKHIYQQVLTSIRNKISIKPKLTPRSYLESEPSESKSHSKKSNRKYSSYY